MSLVGKVEGSAKPKLLVLGEAWGEQEAMAGRPFVGASGQELWRLLGEALGQDGDWLAAAKAQRTHGNAWIGRRGAWLEGQGLTLANVLNFRPPGNKLEALCVPKAEVGKQYPWPPMGTGKYLPEALANPAMQDLRDLLERLRPNLVLACGATATWAMLGATNIGSIRGAITLGLADCKTLPTYHPAAVLRTWSWRPIVLADLMKAAREAQFPEVRRPQRQVLVDPTPAEMAWGASRVMEEAARSGHLANDVETKARQITCISFAGSPGFAMTIPFWDDRQEDRSFWRSPGAEREAWEVCRRLLSHPLAITLGQNYLYDMQYLLPMGIAPRAPEADTMLLHHALFPEMQKGLGFLGSIYTSEPAWKLMRRVRAADKMEKRDE